MKLPTFLIIGVQKAGTTSIYKYLNEHPQVYMSPIKETNFSLQIGKIRQKKHQIQEQEKELIAGKDTVNFLWMLKMRLL